MQLRLALEQSRTEAFLKHLPSIDEHFDITRASASGGGVVDWNDLPHEIRQVYSSPMEYYQEITAEAMTTPHIEQALSRSGMRAVPNEGISAQGSNNCFLISLLQHATGEYRSSHSALVDQYRDILISAPDLGLTANEKISAGSKAARAFVDLINADPSIQPKLNVEVISELNGTVHRDRLGSDAPNARTVVIWDKGGHFEAVTAAPNLARNKEPGLRPTGGVSELWC
jgi:hypothetical protein